VNRNLEGEGDRLAKAHQRFGDLCSRPSGQTRPQISPDRPIQFALIEARAAPAAPGATCQNVAPPSLAVEKSPLHPNNQKHACERARSAACATPFAIPKRCGVEGGWRARKVLCLHSTLSRTRVRQTDFDRTLSTLASSDARRDRKLERAGLPHPPPQRTARAQRSRSRRRPARARGAASLRHTARGQLPSLSD
jgi:hypothetical protein